MKTFLMSVLCLPIPLWICSYSASKPYGLWLGVPLALMIYAGYWMFGSVIIDRSRSRKGP
jgi:hypothetical protein